ncbi:hypothetical protein GCM10022223_62730 [Kineosporia mesophila]|uniref:HTH marR-type domain-containing protein n=1 Tax=Kineosporia mesophila TaxID=566012 RepID=A0ABP7AMX0_9ACTN|nr:MarR family transcriptional regulator [Kineosporia mesophila]
MRDEAGEIAPEVVSEIRRGTTRLARRLRLERDQGGVSGTKMAVLVHLNTHGPSAPKAIAVAERRLPQSLTRSLAELEHDGLVERNDNEADARSSIISITEAGVEVLRQDMASRDAWLGTAMDDLSDLEVQVLLLGAQIMNRIA